MRIGHVITRLIVGGAQENTLSTCRGLQQLGFDTELITGPQTGPEGSLASFAACASPPITVLPSLRREPNPVFDRQACRALARLFRERQFNIVHTHSGKAGILGRLAARRVGVPVIVHTIHGPSFYPHQNPIGNWLFRWFEQLAAEWTTQFVSVADAMTAQYLAAAIGRPSQYVTIHSGIDLDAFANATPAVIPGLEPGDLVVGKIARFFRLKGHEYLFDAAPRILAAVPNLKFLLVGDGIYRQDFEHRAAAMGLRDRFIFTGLVPPADIPRCLARMDALVHLSLREGLPRALVQALAAGKPIVAFDVDGAREVCRDGDTGCLIPTKDTDALVTALTRVLHDQAWSAQLAARGRTLVQAEFSTARMVQQHAELYRSLVC